MCSLKKKKKKDNYRFYMKNKIFKFKNYFFM